MEDNTQLDTEDFIEYIKLYNDMAPPDTPLELSNKDLSYVDFNEVRLQLFLPVRSAKDSEDLKFKIDFRNVTLSRCQFRQQDLRGVLFKGAILKDIDFTGCNLEGVDFSGAKIAHSVFNNCNLTKTKFDSVEVYKTSFHSANLDNAAFENSSVQHSSFKDSSLKSVSFYSSQLFTVDFKSCDMVNFAMSQAKVTLGTFRSSTLTNSDMAYSNINYSTFNNSDLSAILCNETNFTHSSFLHSKFEKADLRNSSATNCNFSESFTRISTFAGLNCDIHIIHDNLRIGDKCFTIDEWKQLTDADILEMDEVIQDIWKKHSDLLTQLVSTSMLTPSKFGEEKIIEPFLLDPQEPEEGCPFD